MVKSRLLSYISKRAVPIVSQQSWTNWCAEPGTPHYENVQVSIVVVIGLDAIEPAELLHQPRGFGSVLESPVALIPVKHHRFSRVHRGENQVEQAIVVEIIHDRATGLIEPIDADQMADI